MKPGLNGAGRAERETERGPFKKITLLMCLGKVKRSARHCRSDRNQTAFSKSVDLFKLFFTYKIILISD